MLASVGFLFQEHYTFTGIDSPSYVSFEQPGSPAASGWASP